MAKKRKSVEVIDPTANVNALVKQHEKFNNMRFRYIEKISALRAKHQSELRAAEAGRLDSIRQVDREEVNKATMAVQAATTTLAAQTVTLAETLRNQAATMAGEFSKRLSALELAVSGSAGKGEGGKQMWGWVAGGIILAIAVASFWMRSH